MKKIPSQVSQLKLENSNLMQKTRKIRNIAQPWTRFFPLSATILDFLKTFSDRLDRNKLSIFVLATICRQWWQFSQKTLKKPNWEIRKKIFVSNFPKEKVKNNPFVGNLSREMRKRMFSWAELWETARKKISLGNFSDRKREKNISSSNFWEKTRE